MANFSTNRLQAHFSAVVKIRVPHYGNILSQRLQISLTLGALMSYTAQIYKIRLPSLCKRQI